MRFLEVHLDQQDVKRVASILKEGPDMERRVRERLKEKNKIKKPCCCYLNSQYRILLQKETSVSNWWSESRRILSVCSPRAWATTLTSDLVSKLENVVICANHKSDSDVNNL